jgi:SAM-dependent methyltransferase
LSVLGLRPAEFYADAFVDELAYKPLDRALLAAFAEEVRGTGPVADLGCGPGHVGAALAARGVDAEGVDLSPAMVAEARRRFPQLRFSVGDLTALGGPDARFAGVVAFYAIVHFEARRLPAAFAEIRRVLRPGAPALVAFHAGTDVVHLDRWFDRDVDATWYFHPIPEVVAIAAAAGLAADAVIDRAPVAQEHPTRRGYLWLRRAC